MILPVLSDLLTFGKIEPFVYKCTVPPLDFLNESGRAWLDPTDGKSKHTESIWNMWDTAMEEGQAVVTAILQWLEVQSKLIQGTLIADAMHLITELREAVAALIGNRSYETGLSCDSGAEILYSDPIWPDAR